MILKDIDMDLPYVIDESKSLLTQEETRKDYDLNWKWKRHEFNLANRCMMAMISRLMPRMKTENFWGITIECVEKSPKDRYLIVGGVCEVQVLFDLSRFYTMTDIEKKKYAIEKAREAMNKLTPLIDVSGILKACDKVAEAGYENIWYWKKSKKTSKKRRSLSVQLKVVHEIDFIHFYMVFNDSKTGKTEEHFIARDKPSEWIFNKYFGTVEWIDDKTARLTTKDGKQFIETCTLSF